MIVKDILYNHLLELLSAFTLESIPLNEYYDSLHNPTKEDIIIPLAEQIEVIRSSIQVNKESNLLHDDYTNLESWIIEFRSYFEDFPNHRINEIELIVAILIKIKTEAPEDFDLQEEIDVTVFCLNEIARPIAEFNFFYFDANDLNLSFILFNFSELNAFKSFLDDQLIPVKLLIHFLSKISEIALEEKQYALIKSSIDGKQSLIRSAISLHILKAGKYIHKPYDYDLKPNVLATRKIQIGFNYQQFNETITILSEYNHQKDILDKYLRLYHVVENFMFKFPLVGMERANNGVPFSIRDFQNMYNKVNVSEISALKDLIRAVLKEDFIPGTKFSAEIFNRWKSLDDPAIPQTKASIDKLLVLLGIETRNKNHIGFDDVNESSFDNFFSQLIYSFRNSLVHNRETEFHLTHDSLLSHDTIQDTARKVLGEFLIPSIEEIVFYLVIENNTVVWYRNSKLTLWKEN